MRCHIILLEERIVYDAAAAALATQTDVADTSHPSAADSAQPLADIGHPLADTGHPLIDQVVDAESSSPKVIVVATTLQNYQGLVDVVASDVKVITYNPYITSADTLVQLISSALNGEKAGSIAIASHGNEGSFVLTHDLVVTNESINTDSLVHFWGQMASMVAEDGRVDLLGCKIASGSGTTLIAALESITGRNFAASTNDTGNAPGADWSLESDNVDGRIYFTSSLAQWDGVLANANPVLASIANKTVNELANLSFTATATDSDVPAQTLTYSLTTSPTGATINSSSGLFSWTPTEVQGPGTYNVTVRVADNGSPVASDSKSFTITVNEVNAIPTIGTIASQSATEFIVKNVTIPGSDTDLPAQSLTYSLIGTNPTGASINPTTGVWSWTPGESDGGTTKTGSVRVSDGVAFSATKTFNVVVAEVNNFAPVLDVSAVAAATWSEGVTQTRTAISSDGDSPTASKTFSFVGASNGATIGSTTGVFSWRATTAQVGVTTSFTIKVTDSGGLTDTKSFTLQPVNSLPVAVSPGDIIDPINQSHSFTSSSTDAGTSVGGTITHQWDWSYDGITFNVESTGKTVTHTYSVTGNYIVGLRVIDNHGATSIDTTFVTIEENTAPILRSDVFNDIGITQIAPSEMDLIFTVPQGTLVQRVYGALDTAGNLYLSGQFNFTFDFDLGPDTHILSPVGQRDTFILKYDVNGDYVWAVKVGGVSGNDNATGIHVDENGFVYVTGLYNSTSADFDPGPGVFNMSPVGDRDGFLVKLDNNGNFVWAADFGGPGRDRAYDVTTDANSNVYVTGVMYETGNFNPGPGTNNLTSNGEGDAWVAKLDSNGHYLWAKNFGGHEIDEGYRVTAREGGGVWVLGSFQGTADFDPGPGVYNLTSLGADDLFVVGLDSNGNFVSAFSVPGIGAADFSKAGVDAGGHLFVDITDYSKNAWITDLLSATVMQVTEGDSVSFEVESIDLDGDDVTFSLEGNVPFGATINPISGVFNIPDGQVVPGNYSFYIVGTDDRTPQAVGKEQIILDVRNQAPTGNLSAPTVLGMDESATVSAINLRDKVDTGFYFAWDLNGDGIYQDAFTATATFTPTTDGIAHVSVQITDGFGAAVVKSQFINVVFNGVPVVSGIPGLGASASSSSGFSGESAALGSLLNLARGNHGDLSYFNFDWNSRGLNLNADALSPKLLGSTKLTIGSKDYNPDAGVLLSGQNGFHLIGDPNAVVTVHLDSNNGSIHLADLNGVVLKWAGDNQLILTGTLADINRALDTLTYKYVPGVRVAETNSVILSVEGDKNIRQVVDITFTPEIIFSTAEVHYVVGQTLILAADAQFSDVDSQHFASGLLVIDYTDPSGSDRASQFDVLGIAQDNAIQLVDGNKIQWNGQTVAIAKEGTNGSPLVIEFNESSTPAAVTEVLRHITYRYDGKPVDASKVARFTIVDAQGASYEQYKFIYY